MAVVYAAYDQVEQRPVALKRLRGDLGEKHDVFAGLFEQEFLALAQLSHPRIVGVYDYGVDADGPYYTMELLDGGDLRRVAPTDYRTACALARDVCSALSLVHSRRLVYRDLSPSNIRRTADGKAKLIDFGGLAPMGPAPDMVGTLPCVPPEALKQAPLDARTDLYSLGATLYFTLTRQHAYPARDVDELLRLFRHRPRAPSELVAGIPPALDQLILSLLDLDPRHRPESAAEVIEHLSVIGGLAHDETLQVKEAYLVTPHLVERSAQLAFVRDGLAQLESGRGASLLVSGPSGSGRSRLLEAAALEAKLSGALVLSINTRGQTDEYAGLRSGARELLRQAPALAREAALPYVQALGALLPELSSSAAPAPSPGEAVSQAELQRALRGFLCAAAQEKPLVLTIDDLDDLDASSLAFVALLARELAGERILILASKVSTSGPALGARGALQVFARASSTVKLGPLSQAGTEQLLGQVFGHVPHLAHTAHHVQRVSGGMPRDVMHFARHLVDARIARYQAGSWSLPAQLDAGELPANMAEALLRRVRQLSPEARALAYALAAEPGFAFLNTECAELLGMSVLRVARVVDELVVAELASKVAGLVRATHSAVSAAFDKVLPEAERSALHARLAAWCERRAEPLRQSRHLFLAGERERGRATLVEFAEVSEQDTRKDPRYMQELLRSLPADWVSIFHTGLEECARAERPRRETVLLLARMSGFLAYLGDQVDGARYMTQLLEELARDAGLEAASALPQDLEPGARALSILKRADERFAALPESERVYDPLTSAKELVGQLIAVLGMLSFTNDHETFSKLPSLGPLAPLSPTMAFVDLLAEGVGLRIAGKNEQVLACYERALQLLEAPDRAGLVESYHTHTRLRLIGAMALLEATMGRESCLERVALLAEDARFRGMTLLVEQLYQAYQGNMREARRIEQRFELLRLEDSGVQAREAIFDFYELEAHVLANDLTGVKRACDAMRARSKLHGAFRAARAYGRGMYQRIRGDYGAALSELTEALSRMAPAAHVLWAPAASAHVRVLVDLGRHDEACALGERYLAAAQDLGYVRHRIQLAVCLALGARGELREAVERAEAVLKELAEREIGGLYLAAAYEVRAQLAKSLGDSEGFRRYAREYAGVVRGAGRHLPEMGALGDGSFDVLPLEDVEDESDLLSMFQSSLESCQSFFERARTGLEFLGRRAGALGGALFTRTEQGLVKSAWFGEVGKDDALTEWATEYFKREVTEHVTEEMVPRGSLPSVQTAPIDAPYTPVLLGHADEQGYAFTGVAVFIGAGPNRRYAAVLVAELSRCIGQMVGVRPDTGS